MNSERESELDVAKAAITGRDAPPSVMIADVVEIHSADEQQSSLASAHIVLGWDADRFVVTDWNWDYLPILGYAIRDTSSSSYVLHELYDGKLHKITQERALQLGILDESGNLRRQGQPQISTCAIVEPYLSMYAQAKCTLSDGRETELLTRIEGNRLPDTGWYVGKRPADVGNYTVREIS
jgi:hypothetical protein